MKPKDKRQLLVVTWVDAVSVDRWDAGDDFPTPYVARTAGFLIDRNEERIIIGGDHFEGDDSLRSVTVIPMCMVMKVERR